MLGWRKQKLESRLLGELSMISDMQTTPPLWQSEEELKSLLMKGKEESEKVGLKLNIQEKAMAPHSSTLAWKIPWTEEPGRLQSMRLLRVGHD